MTSEVEPDPSVDVARLQTWVEKRSRELLRLYDREGEVYVCVPEGGDIIKVHACLSKEHRRLEGPAIPPEAIECEDGRQALIALTSFIFLLPKRAVGATDDAIRAQVWIQNLSEELMARHDRQGHLLTTVPEGPSITRVYAYLAGDGSKLAGPEIRHEWILLENGRRAEAELEAFILSLPSQPRSADDSPHVGEQRG